MYSESGLDVSINKCSRFKTEGDIFKEQVTDNAQTLQVIKKMTVFWDIAQSY
jgi:hypothetical protein